ALLIAGDAAGVDYREPAPGLGAADAVMTVPGNPGLVMDQRVAGTRECVEQGRFADIRPTDQCDDGKHPSLLAELVGGDATIGILDHQVSAGDYRGAADRVAPEPGTGGEFAVVQLHPVQVTLGIAH